MKRVVNTNEAPPGWDFPCSAEINWPVPQLPQNRKFVFLCSLFPNIVFVPASAGIRNAVALRDACYVRVSSRVPDVLGLPGLLMEDTP